MTPFWGWFFAILGGIGSVVSIVWFISWLVERLKKKKKKTTKKIPPDKFFTKWGFWLSLLGLLVSIFFGVWGLCSQKVKGEIQSNGTVSDTDKQENQTPSRVDTLVISPQEKMPTDTVQVPDSNALKVKDPKLDSTCAIFYLEGDHRAERYANEMKDFLCFKRKSLFQSFLLKYYPVVPQNSDWFFTKFPLAEGKEGINPDVLIYYNNGNSDRIKLAERLLRCLKEGIFGIVYTEKFVGGGFDPSTSSNKRNGVLDTSYYVDVSCLPLEQQDKKLQDYDFAIVIPPYYLNTHIRDSIMESLHPPQE